MMTAQEDIFGPFLAMQMLTTVVWFYMFSKRAPFLIEYMEKHKGEMTMKDLGDPTSRHYLPIITPAAIRNPSDNFKNLFEVPILFYAMVVYLYITEKVDTAYLAAAWIFVIFRYIHSAVQCRFNNVDIRFQVYVISSFAVFYMVARASSLHFFRV